MSGLVVLTCMDARIDPLAVLGLAVGEAYVLRNAGAAATDDVARSLLLAHTAKGASRAVVLAHTDCAARADDHEAEVAARATVRALRRLEGLPAHFQVSGLLYDVHTGQVRPLRGTRAREGAAAVAGEPAPMRA